MTELSKNLVCIVIRGGIQIWVERDRSENMIAILTAPNPPQFVKYEDRLINRADVVGVFTALDLEEHTRRKNGEWKCEYNWHSRNQLCTCREKKLEEEARAKADKKFEEMTRKRTDEEQEGVAKKLAILQKQREELAQKKLMVKEKTEENV